jgi:cell division protein FtsB
VKRPTPASSDRPPRRRAPRPPRPPRALLPILATLLFVGVLVVAVFPTRTYLAQRRTVAAANHQLAQLQSANASMRAEAKRLQTDAEIEQQARLHYDYARPNEEVYHVLPAPQKPLTVPHVWPFQKLQPRLDQ